MSFRKPAFGSRDAFGTRGTVSQRSWALAAVCLGLMMAAFSATMVNVALPSIGADLHMADRHLPEILSAYAATFGGAMLMAGNLGDAFGHQRIFVLGVCLFTMASVGCGFAESPRMFIVWRSLQGIGGAVISVLAQCLAANLFAEQSRRTRALGLCACVGASGASVGLTIGGALVSALNWRWIFFLNVAIGAVCAAALVLLQGNSQHGEKKLDTRSMLVASALLLGVMYLTGHDDRNGWQLIGSLAVCAAIAGALVVLLVGRGSNVRSAFVREGLGRMRRIVALNSVAIMLSVAALTWAFACTLYLQRVLAFDPMRVGLVFLPAVAGSAGASLSIAPWLITRFGVRLAAVAGLLSVGVGLTLLWRMPSDALFLSDILPGMLLVGIGTGMSYTPLVHAALRGAMPGHVGMASGLFNTSYMVGGALGLSLLGSIAAARTEGLIAAGVDAVAALSGGYRGALGLSAAIAFAAAVIGAVALHDEAEIEKSPA